MLDGLIGSVERTFVQFSVRRLFFLLFVMTVVVAGAYFVDIRTGYTSFLRLERTVESMERLHALEVAGIKESPELAPLYRQAVAQLTELKTTREVRGVQLSFITEPVIKFLAATCFILLFVLWGLVKLVRRDPEGVGLVMGASITALIFGVPLSLVPTIGSLRFTAIGLIVTQILFMFIVSRWGGRAASA